MDFSYWCVWQFFASPFGVFRVLATVSKEMSVSLARVREDFAELARRGIKVKSLMNKHPLSLSSLDFGPRNADPQISINPHFLHYLLQFEKLPDWSNVKSRLESFGSEEIEEIRKSPLGDNIVAQLAAKTTPSSISCCSMTNFVRVCQACCLMSHHLIENVAQTVFYRFLPQTTRKVNMKQLFSLEWPRTTDEPDIVVFLRTSECNWWECYFSD